MVVVVVVAPLLLMLLWREATGLVLALALDEPVDDMLLRGSFMSEASGMFDLSSSWMHFVAFVMNPSSKQARAFGQSTPQPLRGGMRNVPPPPRTRVAAPISSRRIRYFPR